MPQCVIRESLKFMLDALELHGSRLPRTASGGGVAGAGAGASSSRGGPSPSRASSPFDVKGASLM